MKILIDTNIILDIALERQPFVEAAIRLLEVTQRVDLVLYVTATTITDLYYITRKARGRATARNFIVDLMQFVEVAGVGRTVIEEALHSKVADFEDAVQESAAKQYAIQVIVTRNEKDFENSVLEVHNPESFLQTYFTNNDYLHS
jgi:predicted nucleic acid-binding protein